jgi:hypothetical protein
VKYGRFAIVADVPADTRDLQNVADTMLEVVNEDVGIKKRHFYLFAPVAPLSKYFMGGQKRFKPKPLKVFLHLLLPPAFSIEY